MAPPRIDHVLFPVSYVLAMASIGATREEMIECARIALRHGILVPLDEKRLDEILGYHLELGSIRREGSVYRLAVNPPLASKSIELTRRILEESGCLEECKKRLGARGATQRA